MARALLIQFAIKEGTGEKLSADELNTRMADLRDTTRLDATLHMHTLERSPSRYLCPSCRKAVYPRSPTRPNGRRFWAHLPKSAESCPLAFSRPLSPNQINRLIFEGRQEGNDHKNLVASLRQLAELDPSTVKNSLNLGGYERPSAEQRADFPHGRFPDVSFTYGADKVVLEAQLATIALHGINGTRAFYNRHGSVLLWVTREFNPSTPLRASVQDILADQRGLLLSVDDESKSRSLACGTFQLRAWTYKIENGKEIWISEILPLSDIIYRARPRPWSHDFKIRFIKAFEGKALYDPNSPDFLPFLNEALQHLDIPTYATNTRDPNNLVAILALLISLEEGRPIGSKHPKIISMANSFDSRDGYLYRSLVSKAVEHWRPELLRAKSMQNALRRAEEKLKETGETGFGRNSTVGRLRGLLFPNWNLGS